MKPSIGRIVIVHDATQPSNGTAIMPAIITRMWSDGDPADAVGSNVCINVTAFPDNNAPRPISSISLFETEEEAISSGFAKVAWWPNRERPQRVGGEEATAEVAQADVVDGSSAASYGDEASVS
jgi:hypothetical protein